MILAITGGTGFVGGHLLRLASATGHEVRALARRPQPPEVGVTWVEGALDRPDSLAELVDGAAAVIHVAGVVNAPNRAGFVAGNIDGTAAIAAAACAAGIDRFIHVSSLAAREPNLSDYGWSKAGAEAAIAGSGLDWTMVRPPAIYGPGDTEMLELFRMATRGVMVLPPGGRASLIHVGDLVRLLLMLAVEPGYWETTIEPDDGVPDGWEYRDLARALGTAVGRHVVPLSMPAVLLRAGAFADGLLRGKKAKLTPDRVRYLLHPDWVVQAHPSESQWRPEIVTSAGLKATADWYRAKGWL